MTNPYIVIFRETVALSNVTQTLQGLVQNVPEMKIKRIFTHALPRGAAVDLPVSAIVNLSQHPSVLRVEPDLMVQASAETVPWGIQYVNSPHRASGDTDPSHLVSVPSVDVYILDSGIATHPDLNIVEQVSFIEPAEAISNNHGTMCAGIAAARDNDSGVVGVCPGASLHSIQVLNSAGQGLFSWILAGIDHVLNQKEAEPLKRMVMNMSFGLETGSTSYNSLDMAVDNACLQGVPCVVAAGNSGTNASLTSPAHVAMALTIGAFDINSNWASFSNFGSQITVNGPGVSILSTSLGNGFATGSGTSFSAPFVTGAVAIYLSRWPNYEPTRPTTAQIKAGILKLSLPGVISGVPPNTTTASVHLPTAVLSNQTFLEPLVPCILTAL